MIINNQLEGNITVEQKDKLNMELMNLTGKIIEFEEVERRVIE